MRMIKNVLIKASGDVIDRQEVFDFAREKARNNHTVLVCGAGTKIGEALTKKGYVPRFNEHGRITETFEERKIARDVLEYEQRRQQDRFIGTGVEVEKPLMEVGSVLAPINGDTYVKAAYLGFDEIYIFTLKDRVSTKEDVFRGYDKTEIRGI